MIKIKDIKFSVKKYEYKKPFHITNSVRTEAFNVEVELITSNGIISKAEASPSFRVCGENSDTVMSVADKARGVLAGKDIKRYGNVFNDLKSSVDSPSLKAALEFSILEALCKESGIKVWNFLGGVKKEIETDKTVVISNIKDMVLEAANIKKEGFKILKIKVGENVDKDIEIMAEIYKKTKGMKYIVDANTGYTPKQAVYFAKKLYSRGIDISVYEQPVDRNDIKGLRCVRFKSPYPVAADESVKTIDDAVNLIKKEACDFINIKIMKMGFSNALSIIQLARANDIKLMIGCMSESSLGIKQSVHLACGLGCFDFCDLDSHLLLNEKRNRGEFIQNKNIIKIC